MILQSFIVPIIKVTDSCNYKCKFCYYAQRHSSSPLMSIEVAKNIIKQCFEYNIKNSNKRMRIIFHGGEPLLQPISFYREMIEYEKELSELYNGFEFLNSIQTNGFLLDTEWIEFLAENKFDIGISIDGNKDLNHHYGEAGAENSTKIVLNHISELNEHGVPFGVIAVITNKHLKEASKLYEFCIENDIHDLSLNYCYNSETNDTVENEDLILFVKKLFDLYYNGSYELNIREFNELIAKRLGLCTDTCATCDRNNCGQYMSFDSYGNVFFCDSAYDKNSKVGNLTKKSLIEIIDSFEYLQQLYICKSVYNRFCNKCTYVEYCGGGCHRYDIIDADGKYLNNYFCPTHKALIDHIEKELTNAL